MKSWKEISETDQYNSLSPAQQVEVKRAYWDNVLSSQLPTDISDGDIYKTKAAFFGVNEEVLPKREEYDPLNEMSKFDSVVVGVGHMMTDSWRGFQQMFVNDQDRDTLTKAILPSARINQMYGIEDPIAGVFNKGLKEFGTKVISVDEAELADNQRMMNKLYSDEELGNYALGGGVVGAFAEPLGLILPGAKGKSLWNIAKTGAKTGGIFGAVGYVDEESGQTRFGNMMFGSVTGGILSPTLIGTYRGLNAGRQKLVNRSANTLLRNIEETIAKNRIKNKMGVEESVQAAYKQLGVSDGDVASIILRSDRTEFFPYRAAFKDEASKNLARMEERIQSRNITQKVIHPIDTIKHSKFLLELDKLIEPISSSIEKRHKPLANSLRSMDARQHIRIGEWVGRINPFIKFIDTLPKQTQKQLKGSLIHGNIRETISLLRAHGGQPAIDSYKEVRKVLNEIYDLSIAVGYKLPKLKNFFPRIVEDIDKVSKIEHDMLSTALRKARKKKGGKELSPREVHGVINSLIRKPKTRYATTSGSLKRRYLQKIDEEMMDAYANPDKAIISYIHEFAEDISRREFFRSYGYNPKSLDISGGDLDKSVRHIIDSFMKSGELSPKQASELIQLLRSRFSGAKTTPHKYIQDFKNLTSAVTLGNHLSAAVQFGDLIFTMHKYGLIKTIATLFGEKTVTKEMMGLVDAVEELGSTRSGTKKILDWSLKWGEFNRVDKLGKETLLNTALKHYSEMVKTPKGRERFKKQWGEYFEKETDSLMDDLNNKKLSDNVKLLLWNELADVQPISLSEMPQKYSDSPNGRLLYMFRSFTIKQLDFMRKRIRNNPNKADAMLDTAKFGFLFVMGNSTIDMFRDYMIGKDPDIEDHIVDNMWQLIGMNKFTADKASRMGLGTAAIDILAPPLTVYDPLFRSILKGDPEEIATQAAYLTPITGKLIKGWTED